MINDQRRSGKQLRCSAFLTSQAFCCRATSPYAELCDAHAVKMHDVFEISAAFHWKALTFTLSLEGQTNLKNIVHSFSPDDIARGG